MIPSACFDDANNRYYSNAFGRFMTPDPYKAGNGSGDASSPQSWNRYAPQSCTPPPAQVLRTYYYDTNPLDTTGFSKNIAGRLAAVKYPAQSTVQMNDMYSYTAAGTAGAGLPAKKRLQVNQPVEYKNNSNQNENENVTMNLDAVYTYNTEGEMTAVTYPSTGTSLAPVAGASYTYSYDSMYRLSGMKQSTTTIVNNVSYNAANQLLTMNYGLAETRTYNVLNQLTNVTAGTSENLTYNYPTGTNNGKVSSMYNAVSGETITYTYDSLNRLLTANGSGWGQQYGFDGFGNLLSKTVTSGSGPSLSVSVNPANNQIQGVSGLSYDANGNQNAGTYDAENRLISDGVQYAYDAQNKRIWNWPGNKDSLNNTTRYTVNMYSPGRQKLGAYLFVPATTTQNGLNVPILQVTLSSSDQYFGGRRLAVMDQLGSVVSATSPVISYFPWGEAKSTTNPQDTWNFATYWQDSVSGLDYANNRYYSNAYGRFMTPDPYRANGGGPGNPRSPQSWNKYAYSLGDPINNLDPRGLLTESVDGDDDDGGGIASFGFSSTVNRSKHFTAFTHDRAYLIHAGGILSSRDSISADCQGGLNALGVDFDILAIAASTVDFQNGTTDNNSIASAYGNASQGAAAQAQDNKQYAAWLRAHGQQNMTIADYFAATGDTAAWTPWGATQCISIHLSCPASAISRWTKRYCCTRCFMKSTALMTGQ